MDWLDKMNAAMKYLENNLEGDIDYEELARLACCSSYHFQRMFSFITDVTLAEYIRRRRLTLAAMDLQKEGSKVIDISYKYGYDSPTSFSRAFFQMHQVTPRDAKEQGTRLKAYPPISFQISIKGDRAMNYRVEEKDSFRLVGVKETVSNLNGENFKRIPKIWDEVYESGQCDTILKLSNQKPSGVMGVCANFCKDCFDYYIASSSTLEAPKGYDVLDVAKSTWVIFECTGPLPDAMQSVWKRIFTEWFPQSEYEHANGPEIEWYSDGDSSSQDYISEIWIPIIKK
jgi:AraC family transcriptional regulator